jgi:hypothetical protein
VKVGFVAADPTYVIGNRGKPEIAEAGRLLIDRL